MSGDLMYASVFLALAIMVLVPSVLVVRLRPTRRRMRGRKGGLAPRPLGRPRQGYAVRFGQETRFGRRQR